jgi:hypothetical protein
VVNVHDSRHLEYAQTESSFSFRRVTGILITLLLAGIRVSESSGSYRAQATVQSELIGLDKQAQRKAVLSFDGFDDYSDHSADAADRD